MKSIRILAVLSVAAATSAAAQGPPPGPRGSAPRQPAAEMLLSQTGELGLTDAQVVRLAAIARRSEARRRAMRASMDSAEGRFRQPGDSVARRQFGERMRAELPRAQEQMQADQRDAIAVLTPDQQARAWTMVSSRGQRGFRGGRGFAPGERGMRRRPMGEGPRMRLREKRGPRPQMMREPRFRRPLRQEGSAE
jgi:hypothetical protein